MAARVSAVDTKTIRPFLATLFATREYLFRTLSFDDFIGPQKLFKPIGDSGSHVFAVARWALLSDDMRTATVAIDFTWDLLSGLELAGGWWTQGYPQGGVVPSASQPS